MKQNLPALDDEVLRKNNAKKIVDAIYEVGNHFKELRRFNKVTTTIAAISGLLMLLLLGTIVYATFSIEGSSFVDSFVDRDLIAARYKCCVGDDCLTMREPKSAASFKELYPNATCTFWDVRDNHE